MNREQSRQPTEWSPSRFFSSERPAQPFALILLNQPLNWTAFEKISKSASITICADGGANRLHQESSQNGFSNRYVGAPETRACCAAVNAIVERERLIMGQIPDAIIGDLDSLDENVEAFYQGNGVAIVRDPDQYSTDFTKCLKWLRQTAGSTQGLGSRLDIVALGGLGGRVDQGFSQIHHLYMATRNTELLVGEIYLLSEQSLSFVLEEGCNRIELSRKIFAENVGIIPITGPAVITTRGLEWDVQNWKTEFGGKISTSNHLKSETIEIETTTRVLFTVELLEDLTVKVTTAA